MKRIKYLICLLSLLVLSACGGGVPMQDAATDLPPVPDTFVPQAQTEEPDPVEPTYVFESDTQARSFTLADGGEEYASYSYTLPVMIVSNMDELDADEKEIAQRNAAAFNAEMETVMREAVDFGESLAEEIRMLLEEESFPWVGCDEISSTVFRAGEIVTVRANCYYFGGGAHPNTYSMSYTFDLALGQFVDPAQIGDDPETFRQSVAQLLIAQAEGLGEDFTEGLWDDYPSIIAKWNDTAVFFDESGMTVFFSAYELGPYAMGPVELFLDYETLAEPLGPGGLAHLGVTE